MKGWCCNPCGFWCVTREKKPRCQVCGARMTPTRLMDASFCNCGVCEECRAYESKTVVRSVDDALKEIQS